jgi:hypothetical protein
VTLSLTQFDSGEDTGWLLFVILVITDVNTLLTAVFTFNYHLWPCGNRCTFSLSVILLIDISYFHVARHVKLNMILGSACHGVGFGIYVCCSNCFVRP